MNTKIVTKQIIEMARIDQALRFKAGRARKKLKNRGIGTYNYLVYIIDQIHNLKIKDLIHTCGYPSSRMIGKEEMNAFWILIQHQDFDLALQKACLRRCDFSRVDAAYLEDRVLVNEGKKQTYGTQLTGKFDRRGEPIPKPIRNPQKLDERRKSVGL
jgi:hypothetical protein